LIQAATPPTSPLFPYTTLFRSTKAPPFSQNPSLRDFSHYTSLYPPVQADGYGQSVTGLQKEGKTKRRFLTKPPPASTMGTGEPRSEEHTSELQSRFDLVCRLLL